ncbi:MAG: type I-A CRISPR-associated protein Cas4/Csa1 [Zestosphaera sp.]
MVVKSDVVFRWVRLLRSKFEGYVVDEELRGWSWIKPPIRPRAHLGLSVYDVASYCPTRRDVWLRRVVGVKSQTTSQMRCGFEVHNVIGGVISIIRRSISSNNNYESTFKKAEKHIESVARNSANTDLVREVGWLTYHTLMAEYMWYEYGGSAQPALLWLNEVRVDGTPIGLSSGLRVDALPIANIIVDIKVGRRYENHDLMLVAYALALEANLEIPVDYGILIYISWLDRLNVDAKGLYIGPDARREFIDARDEVIDMLLSGREPPKARECITSCPYSNACGGEE